MTLDLEYERCVRTRAVSASCTACVDVCPVKVVSLAAPRLSVEVALEDCVACGLCQAACPTEALSGAFDVAALVARAPKEVRCGHEGLFCVGALSVEDLLSLALKVGQLNVVAQSCMAWSTGHPRAKAAVAEATLVLASLDSKATVHFSDVSVPMAPPPRAPPRPPVPPRREFLGLFVPGAVPPRPRRLSQPERLDVARLRDTPQTSRRQRLLAALPPAAEARVPELETRLMSFSSAKVVNEATCTGCMQCVTACPTAALTTPRLRQQLRFDASRCVKCHLCHDVCEPGAITLAPAFHLGQFLDFSPTVLVTLKMTQCVECGGLYKAGPPVDDAAALCPRCQDQDSEARELWGQR